VHLGEITNAHSDATDNTLLGITGAVFSWAGLWIFFGLLQLLPHNRTSSWASDLISGMADGEPSWYRQILLHIGSSLNGIGTSLAIVMAALFFLIGLGPIFSGRPSIFFKLAIGLAVIFWFTGEAMGQILTGMGTDPNQGPILVIFALCVMPLANVYADRAALNPRKLNGRSYLATLGLVALATVPAFIAVFPGAQSQAANQAHVYDSGAMAGMTMTLSGSSKSNKSVHVMNMAGMAGLNVVDPNWKYTGPPLPASEVALLNAVSSVEDKGHKMQTPNCMTPPTATQLLQATQYVQATTQGVAKYKNLSAAIADGYFPITDTRYPVVHYLNLKYMSTKYIFDPNHVDSLVYAFTPYGPVLVAAMYLMPGPGKGPMPFGCLVQWHAHTNLCFSLTTHQISGFLPCPPGTVYYGVTPMMTHVWLVPVPGGPLAIDPSDLQVVEAAIMAQQEGLAPSNGPIP
jgi:hypothetical protein